MKIEFTKEEAEGLYFDALCNGLSTLGMSGIELQCDDAAYKEAATKLKSEKPTEAICFEDVLMRILKDGGKLKFVDLENGGEYTKEISLEDVYTNLPLTPTNHLLAMVNEEGDAITADVILQTVLYKEIIFG